MKIVLLGDSVTKGTGYGGVLTTETFGHLIGLSAGYPAGDIINKGVGGNNTADLLARLTPDVIALAPDVCLVMIGNNDISGTGKKLPVATFKSNVALIIARLKAGNIKPVFVSPNMERGSNALFASFDPYIQALEEACAAADVCYVDLYRELCFAALRNNFMPFYVDTVHLSKAGHQFVASYAARSKHAGFFTA